MNLWAISKGVCDQNPIRLMWLSILLACLCARSGKGASFVEATTMGTGRFVGTATLLPDGQVLLAGGGEDPTLDSVASSEIYDPASRVWSFVGSMSVSRIAHTAVLLANGKVLVAGGNSDFTNLATAELYD